MEHDISHIKDIGDIMNIFFNSRIYTNQSFVNALFGKQQKTTRSQDAGCNGTRIRKEEYIIQMLTKVLI